MAATTIMDVERADLARSADDESASVAFRRLFDTEFAYVYRALRRLGVADTDLKDIAQEVFVAVHRHFGEYDCNRPVRPWLFSFARRMAANHRRRTSREQSHDPEAAEAACGQPTPEEQLLDEHARS